MLRELRFEEVAAADLWVDAVYRGGADLREEPLHTMFRCGIGGGFRYKRDPRTKRLLFVILFTTGVDPDWPDHLDTETGLFTYYGDNRQPGELHKTKRLGNVILRDTFGLVHAAPPRRDEVAPFFVFTRGPRGHDVVFRGLAAPGSPNVSPLEQLVAVWKSKGDERFQNYKSIFSVLDAGVVERRWIDDLLACRHDSPSAPGAWSQWVRKGIYRPLQAQKAVAFRTKEEQLPKPGLQAEIVKAITDAFHDDPYGFERCAAEVFRLMEKNVVGYELTRPWRDGGRDALGRFRIGSLGDAVDVEFALEAKCYSPGSSVGVRETSRLISRLRHRQFGVLVTTSYVHRQAYEEIKDDAHPVLIVSGRDVAAVLVEHGYSTVGMVMEWLRFLQPQGQ